METVKLYYEDPNIREFTALVLDCTAVQGGWEIILDRTAFYPEGGGQACDLGTLADVPVLDVRERGQQVVHLCDGPFAPNTQVTGKIDWERRFDLMQQHTGEHIISGIVHRIYGYGNCGFHVGEQVMEVDFDGIVPQEDIPKIEDMANRLQGSGLSLEQYLGMMGMNMDIMKAQAQVSAAQEVRSGLALEAVAEAEGIVISDEEADAKMVSLAEQYGADIENVRASMDVAALKKDMATEKALEVVKSTVKKPAKPSKKAETEAEGEQAE